VSDAIAVKYARAIHVVNRLAEERGLRRFSPREILRLHGFADSFALPFGLSIKHLWPLVGNSLSLPPLRHALSFIPDFAASNLTIQ
jgi:hypothetical protein